jgi:hypothetical protein
VSGTSSASVTPTRTACEPKIVEKFAVVRNVSGRRIPKTTMTPPQTTRSA